MALALELEVDAVVHEPFALHPLADAGRAQQIDRALLEHARAQPPLDVRAVAALEHDRLDALECEQMREHQPRGPGADDRDLGALFVGQGADPLDVAVARSG